MEFFVAVPFIAVIKSELNEVEAVIIPPSIAPLVDMVFVPNARLLLIVIFPPDNDCIVSHETLAQFILPIANILPFGSKIILIGDNPMPN